MRVNVQIIAPYLGKANCGVSQTIKYLAFNEVYQKSTAGYLGVDPAMINVNSIFPEPVLSVNDAFDFSAGWFPRYNGCMMSFADSPSRVPDAAGITQYTTCFFSKAKDCRIKKCCVTWTFKFDFTVGKNVNKVEAGASVCE
jgi:hypothetical protein